MFKRVGVVLVFVALLMLTVTGVALAHGLSPAKLSNAGWLCMNVPGLGVHCFAPGAFRADASVQASVFQTSDPTATDALFAGTETLIRADLYAGQPCPTEGEEEYHLLPAAESGLPVDYRACHHYSSSP